MSQPNGKLHSFSVPFARLQPSQLYINAAKLRCVQDRLNIPSAVTLAPLPVLGMGGDLVLTDGHTRAFTAWSAGLRHLRVAWDTDELDVQAYEICVQWCVQEGIRTISDLQGRVVDLDTYRALWLDRCAAMHRILAAQRAGK